jgi:hypothetical protein
MIRIIEDLIGEWRRLDERIDHIAQRLVLVRRLPFIYPVPQKITQSPVEQGFWPAGQCGCLSFTKIEQTSFG